MLLKMWAVWRTGVASQELGIMKERKHWYKHDGTDLGGLEIGVIEDLIDSMHLWSIGYLSSHRRTLYNMCTIQEHF